MIARVFRRQHGKKLINRAARALIHTFPTAANVSAVTSLQGGLTSLLVELTSLQGRGLHALLRHLVWARATGRMGSWNCLVSLSRYQNKLFW